MNPSKELSPAPDFSNDSPLHSTECFELYIGPWPNPLWEGQQGYFILNTRTGVIEGVLGTEAMALQEMRLNQSQLDAALSGAGPQTTADDRAFQEMMARLNQGRNTE